MDTGALMAKRTAPVVMLLALALMLGLPASAPAVAPPVVSAQASAANAAFLAYAPAPPVSGAMCLVDTGVNQTPDTTPTLAYETALDEGSPGDDDPEGHGTMMAILAGGQGHGLRGIWPQIKIVSIRASSAPAPGQTPTYQYQNYVQGLTACLQQSKYNIETVNLSLSSTIPPTPDQSSEFAQVVRELTSRGIAILAAAGNTPGAVQYPGAEPGVISVGAGTITGGTCSFSATETVGIFAPGCELDFADPFSDEYEPTEYAQGTSEASVIAAASLTALMSYAPKLTLAQAENLLVTTAVAGHLNVAAAFEAAGLGSIVAAGNAAIPPEPTPPASGAASAPAATAPIPAAAVRSLVWRHGTLTLRLRTLPAAAEVHLRAVYPRRKALSAAGATKTLRLRCPRPRKVTVWITEGTSSGPTSNAPLGFHATVTHRKTAHAKRPHKKR
jgi:Subtilase family